MLNPPLSLLSDDLFVSIVEQLAKLRSADAKLKNLSLADRAFTESCQKYIFRKLILGKGSNIFKQLTKAKKSFDDNPSFANRVRMLELRFSGSREEASFFKDPDFTSILQLLAKSPMPPHELHLHGLLNFIIEDSILVTRKLGESFFSQTLNILRVSGCEEFPLPLFLICPGLREVVLDRVGTTDKMYDKYPDNYCSGREAPLLKVLEYSKSHSLVEQMIAPPPRFNTPVVLWSNLRVLTVAPHDKKGMACLQLILDAACNTLEELYLTRKTTSRGQTRQLSLSGLVNLSNLPNLHVFALYTIVNCEASFAVLCNINIVLGTIPESNIVTNLSHNILIVGRCPFHGCLNEDWVEMFNEVIRIAGRKPLELDLRLAVSSGTLESERTGQDELYMHIMEMTASLLDYPNICTHWWNPTLGTRPFPSDQVHMRCRR